MRTPFHLINGCFMNEPSLVSRLTIISRPTFLTSVLILSRAFVFIRFSGFRLYIELCNMTVDSFCN